MPEQVESCRAVEARQLDVLDAGVGGGVGHVRGGGEQEGALGGGVQQFVEGGPAELQVVQDDDGADLADALQQFVPVGAVQGRVEDRVEEVVEEVVGAAAVAVEADHSVGREIGAVLGDDVEQPGAAGAAGADESHGAAAGEQPYQRLPLVLTGQQGQRRLRGARGTGGAAARSTSARSGSVSLPGRAGRSAGGQGSISLPSTGLTVSRKSPETSCTVRAGTGACCPKSEVRIPWEGAGAARRRRGRTPRVPCGSGP